MSVNKVIILGNCGQDPETRYTSSGSAVTNVTVATTEKWKDKQTGQPQERTEWHRIVFYNRLAEIAGEYLRKGSKVYIEGSLRTNKWQDQHGNDRYTTEVVARELTMLDSRSDNSQQAAQSAPTPQQQAAHTNYATPAAQSSHQPAPQPPTASQVGYPGQQTAPPAQQAPSSTPFDEDIPF